MTEQYRELAQGVRMIRQAVEETFGVSVNSERAETALQECEMIAKAIYSLCPICHGARWVGEDHPEQPWGPDSGDDAGVPCRCNPDNSNTIARA